MKITIMLALAVTLLGCQVRFDSGSDEQVAVREGSPAEQAALRTAASTVLKQLDAERWNEAWDSSASSLRKVTTQAAFIDGVNSSRQMYGAPPAARMITGYAFPESVQGVPPGKYGIVSYSANFSKSQNVEEQVVLQNEGGQWRLAGYWATKRK